LATDLEPSAARRIFPGWDEPVFKATIALSVVVPASFLAVSNMPVVREEAAGPGRKKVTFAPTPKMSPYLLALVAGEFERINRTVAGVDVGVVAPSHQIEQGRFALDTAEKVIPYYSDYFGSKFPLPKLDNVLIPNYFSAMENWGAATYEERALLFDPAASTQDARQYVFEMVGHELAHQWFGNLVTNAWWDNLWLNEGFSTWMQKKATNDFNPTWKTWLRAHTDKEKALTKDALRTTHAVQQPIEDESQALAAFDDITYWKGMSIVRMLEAYLGEAAFRDGIRRYMKAHAYSSATTADLWAALEAASRKPVAKIAAGFAELAGVPLIHVTTTCEAGKLTTTLRQGRFTINDPYAVSHVWQVPVALGRPGDVAPARTLLVDGPKTVTFDGCDRPVKANFGDVGYYRVQYEEASLLALASSFRRLPAADRNGLMADAWAMVLAGRSPAAGYLELTKQLSNETELAVWETVIASLQTIDNLLVGASVREKFRVYARDLVRPLMGRLGWVPGRDDAPEIILLRALAIETLGHLRDDDVLAEARRRFSAFVQDRGALHKDLREPVAKVVGYSADRRTYQDLHRLAQESSGDQEKMVYYLALARAGDPQLIDETVTIARNDPKLPQSQVGRFLEAAAAESGDADRVWSLVFENREAILVRLAELKRQELLPKVARASSSPSVAFALKWADVSRAGRGARLRADEAVEEIEAKADLKPRLVPAVAAWLKTIQN
jgi:aminopeptidase N